MKKILCYITLTIWVLMISGCWDKHLLKDVSLNMAVGFDLGENQQLETTASIPISQDKKKSSIIVTAVGKTPRDTRIKIDLKIPDTLDASKNTLVLIGEKLAKQDIYNILDVFYRNPKSALNARLAVVEGKTSDLIIKSKEKSSEYNGIPSEHLCHILCNAEDTTHIVKENLKSICTLMFDPGKDYMLPLLGFENSKIATKGLAMFHDKKMTGKLNTKESIMYLLLRDKKGKIARFTEKVNDDKNELANYISFNVGDVKRKIDINISEDDDIIVKIDLKLKVTITEYPLDKLHTEEEIKKLNAKLSKILEALANTVIQKMQEANCDALGIGRRLIAFHNETWKRLDWEKEYQDIKFDTNVTVNIISNGIIN